MRSKPQRNAYHRFTVDRHLIETAANAAVLVARTDRPDLLVLGALLHDIGKGYPGDHTDVGIELLDTIGPRMGYPPRRRGRAAGDGAPPPPAARRRHPPRPRRPRHHPAVADAVGDPLTLSLLAALTEADSLATGPAAWGRWKADLVRDLVRRTAHVLGGGSSDEVPRGLPHGGAARAARRRPAGAPGRRATGSRSSPTTAPACSAGSPGCSRCTASACSTPRSPASTAWPSRSSASSRASARRSPGTRCVADLERALEGRLALQARLAERARVYGGRSRPGPIQEPPRVFVDNDGVARRHGRGGPRPRLDGRALPDHPRAVRPRPRHRVGQGPDARRPGGRRLLRAGPGRRRRSRTPPCSSRSSGPSCTSWPAGRPEADGSSRTPPTHQDLVRWSETLAGIARTGLGFTESLYERERFEEVLHVAGDIRAAAEAERRARRRRLRRGVDAERRRGRRRLRHARSRRWARSSTTTSGGILLVQRADSGVWLYPTGWADVGLLGRRGGGEGGAARRPASTASPRA